MPIDDEQLWDLVLQGMEEAEASLHDDDDDDRAGASSLVQQVVAECIAMAERRTWIEWDRLERNES